MKREFDNIKTPADESFEWYFINWLKSSGIAFAIAAGWVRHPYNTCSNASTGIRFQGL